ncbi:MAG: FtsQ-type POTRA domain-containing protein [Clostridia bacterium]|nr:FtsQ-type POTRA domain-containing protein [Clostridia bacterium]
MRRRKQRMNLKLKMVLTFLLVLCLGTGIGAMFTPVFHISEVLCEGIVRIPPEEIFAVTGDIKGKNIFAVSLSDIQSRVKEIPMVERLKIQRVFPDKIKIIVEECIPAGYILTDDQCVVADLEGKVLEIITDERVDAMVKTYSPKEPPKKEETKEGEPVPTPSATPAPTAVPQVEEDEMQSLAEGDLQSLRGYSVPLILGIQLHKPEIGKKVESKDKESLERAFSILLDLEKAGLLSRATYLDLRDWEDVTLMIENRLEIQLGAPENMEYRSAFLAEVINNKMSSTEHAIMDYRKPDIYVRQPEDGLERVKPSASPTPTAGKNPKKTTAPTATFAPTSVPESATVLDMDEE